MSNLINIKNEDGKLLASSREVADNFGKEHKDVLETIRNLTAENSAVKNIVIESEYKNSRGRKYPEYLLTRDGFTLLAMGFTGKKALEWKLKYIEAFNKMEEEIKRPKPLSTKEELRLHYQVLEEQEEKITEIDNKVNQLESNMPLFSVDCKELQALVRKVGTKTLGGYRSPAYNDNSLRGKVYADIQSQIKREFGVSRYEAIRRVQIDQAKEIVRSYSAPLVLAEKIQMTNRQMAI